MGTAWVSRLPHDTVPAPGPQKAKPARRAGPRAPADLCHHGPAPRRLRTGTPGSSQHPAAPGAKPARRPDRRAPADLCAHGTAPRLPAPPRHRSRPGPAASRPPRARRPLPSRGRMVPTPARGLPAAPRHHCPRGRGPRPCRPSGCVTRVGPRDADAPGGSPPLVWPARGRAVWAAGLPASPVGSCRRPEARAATDRVTLSCGYATNVRGASVPEVPPDSTTRAAAASRTAASSATAPPTVNGSRT